MCTTGCADRRCWRRRLVSRMRNLAAMFLAGLAIPAAAAPAPQPAPPPASATPAASHDQGTLEVTSSRDLEWLQQDHNVQWSAETLRNVTATLSAASAYIPPAARRTLQDRAPPGASNTIRARSTNRRSGFADRTMPSSMHRSCSVKSIRVRFLVLSSNP